MLEDSSSRIPKTTMKRATMSTNRKRRRFKYCLVQKVMEGRLCPPQVNLLSETRIPLIESMVSSKILQWTQSRVKLHTQDSSTKWNNLKRSKCSAMAQTLPINSLRIAKLRKSSSGNIVTRKTAFLGLIQIWRACFRRVFPTMYQQVISCQLLKKTVWSTKRRILLIHESFLQEDKMWRHMVSQQSIHLTWIQIKEEKCGLKLDLQVRTKMITRMIDQSETTTVLLKTRDLFQEQTKCKILIRFIKKKAVLRNITISNFSKSIWKRMLISLWSKTMV
mgnify:CR=1 FL=1